uniref:CID domain-containing protein n=1 Tax=Tetraodon nigroviridis TaxID=99883 RepID=H3DFS8_TETNG
MEAVKAFNMELFSMIDMKPPISRAKMMSVTKAAIKAIKLYKHVVQIVEKFIKKCKPELKVPGLYVVDSIVRQSRHQFGVDKDVFGPRFQKNFTDTFQNLYHCPEEDKNKIVRVLHLWQKNGVFDINLLQSLLDMANGNKTSPNIVEAPQMQPPVTSPTVVPSEPQLPASDALAAVAQLFQSPHGQELQRILQNFQQEDKTLSATFANNMATPPHVPLPQLNPYSTLKENKSSLAEKLLDRFEYDDDPEDIAAKEGGAQPQSISEKLLIESLQRMAQSSSIQFNCIFNCLPFFVQDRKMSHTEHPGLPDRYHPIKDAYSHLSYYCMLLSFSMTSSLGTCLPNLPEFATLGTFKRRFGFNSGVLSTKAAHESEPNFSVERQLYPELLMCSSSLSWMCSRSPRRRSSRSSSRSRRGRPEHSRSRESRWRSRSQDRSERENNRERRQKGLPSIKSQTLSGMCHSK